MCINVIYNLCVCLLWACKMQITSIRLDLKGEIAQKFATIKKSLGFKANTSVLIHLINEGYENTKNATKEAPP